jgi:hypothetical protein
LACLVFASNSWNRVAEGVEEALQVAMLQSVVCHGALLPPGLLCSAADPSGYPPALAKGRAVHDLIERALVLIRELLFEASIPRSTATVLFSCRSRRCTESLTSSIVGINIRRPRLRVCARKIATRGTELLGRGPGRPRPSSTLEELNPPHLHEAWPHCRLLRLRSQLEYLS